MPSPCGNLQGLKPNQLAALERLYKRKLPRDAVCTPDQARELALLSRSLGRQLGLLVDRSGKVRMVIAGDPGRIMIPELPHHAGSKLRGWRLLHTHLDPSGLSQEDLMDLLFLRLDGVVSLNVNAAGDPSTWQAGWLVPPGQPGYPGATGPMRPWSDLRLDLATVNADFEGHAGADFGVDEARNAVLVCVSSDSQKVQERNLAELAALADAAGLEVVGTLRQRVGQANARHILGKGKLAELEVLALQGNAGTLVFDGELAPAQLHNLAEMTERRVLDRTQLILDIFAQRAFTQVGRLQVELAQLAYAQPRLAGSQKALDRLRGGIGGRGPGESRLETDRRRIRERIAFLKKELARVRKQRAFVRQRRERNGIPTVALVGYTNAGKSTLLNALTQSEVFTCDQLFATLDTATRRLRFPCQKEIVLSDTVGFIRNLPGELREAFMATLEELEGASLILHLADASSPDLLLQMRAVSEILDHLVPWSLPRLLVFNKIDALNQEELATLQLEWPEAVFVSATRKRGFDELLQALERELFLQKLAIPLQPETPPETL